MRPWTKLSVLLFLATWAELQGTMIAQPSRGKKPALDFSGTVATEGTGENTAFARSVSARYGGGMSVCGNHGRCRVAGLQAAIPKRPPVRERAWISPGVEAWIVDLLAGRLSGQRPDVRRCMGEESGPMGLQTFPSGSRTLTLPGCCLAVFGYFVHRSDLESFLTAGRVC